MKDELIVLYCGEILVDDEDEIRDHFDDTFSFYNYSFSDDKYSIEARFCGNESRFINHNNNNYINSKTR
jgi:histone-lysine N-methyltransferase EZH2